MKKALRPMAGEELSREFPIGADIEGWRFRESEISNGCWRVEGRDATGHSVSRSGVDPEELLKECVSDAREIAERLQSK